MTRSPNSTIVARAKIQFVKAVLLYQAEYSFTYKVKWEKIRMELDHEENHIVRMLVQNAKEMNYKGLDCYLIVTEYAN